MPYANASKETTQGASLEFYPPVNSQMAFYHGRLVWYFDKYCISEMHNIGKSGCILTATQVQIIRA